ncbi:MAG: tyrosine-type recombinase/integrase [Planctomycetota bacterium]|jgi:site-specific recombinase XerD
MDEVRARKVIRNLKLKGLDQPTIKQCINMINSIYNACREVGHWQGKSPLYGLRIKQSKHRRIRTLSIAQCLSILNAFKAASRPLYWVIAVFCYRLGMRPAEVLSLRPMDIVGDTIIVPDVKTPTGNHKTRKLFLNSTVVKEAVAYLERLPVKRHERFFPKKIDTEYVNRIFSSEGHNEGIDSRDTVNRVTLYTLRHSYATQMLENGADLKQVQAAMGHDSLASTMVYLHAANTAGREGQAILDAVLDEAGKPELKVINGGFGNA